MKKNKKGFTLVELLVVIAIIALLMGILMPALARVRQIAFRMVCGSNLSGMGRAMLIYANDYDNDFPRAGFQGSIWSSSVTYDAPNRRAAFMVAPTANTGGQATITSSFYLLVRYAEVTPKSFVCKGEPASVAFKATDWGKEDEEVWDFGPTSAPSHCSYSYHLPYYQLNQPVFALSTASSEPGMAVAADRNPFLDNSSVTSGFKAMDHNKDQVTGYKLYQLGNAGAHQREGQNVLFMDNHVYFEKESYCGVDEDNIYRPYAAVRQQGADIVCDDFLITPLNLTDSLLVNECLAVAAGTPPVTPPTGPGVP